MASEIFVAPAGFALWASASHPWDSSAPAEMS